MLTAVSYNERRKLAYQYYRRMGYSPTQARKLRNRVDRVISDVRTYNKTVRRESQSLPPNLRRKPLSLPRIATSKSEVSRIYRDLKIYGLSKKLAARWAGADKALSRRMHRSLSRYMQVVKEATGRDFKEFQREFKKQVGRLSNESIFWERCTALYISVVGFKIRDEKQEG